MSQAASAPDPMALFARESRIRLAPLEPEIDGSIVDPGTYTPLGDGIMLNTDSDWFRAALAAQGATPCIPPRKNRIVQYHDENDLYRQRHKIDNVFGRIKDWRRVATRYDRRALTFMSAIRIAATCCYSL